MRQLSSRKSGGRYFGRAWRAGVTPILLPGNISGSGAVAIEANQLLLFELLTI